MSQEKYIPVAHFKKICRVCLVYSENLISIHKIVFIHGQPGGTVAKLSLTKVLKKYCNVQVLKSDAKPQQVCQQCTDLLSNAFNIFSLFELSNLRLDKILEKYSSLNRIKDQSKSPVCNNSDSGLDIKVDSSNVDFEIAISRQSNENLDPLLVKVEDEEADQTIINNEDNIRIDPSHVDFEIAISGQSNENLDPLLVKVKDEESDQTIIKSEDDSITILENPLDIDTENSRCKDELVVDNGEKQIVDNHGRMETSDHTYSDLQAESSDIRMPIGTNTATIPRPGQKRMKDIRKQQLEKMYLRYQRKHNIFSCMFCEGLTIQGIDKVIDHMKNNHPLTIECILCAKKFTETELLMAHVASHAKKQKRVCDKCFIYFMDQESLEAHYNSEDHKNVMSKCHICNMEFKHEFRLKRHIQEVHFNKRLRQRQCPKCRLVLKYRENLSKHLQTHKGIMDRTEFFCERCAKSYTTSTTLKRHMRITHADHVDLIKEWMDKRLIERSENRYACEYCERTLSTKTAFFTHRISHPECKDIVCPLCDRVLPNPVEYRRHRRAVHFTHQCECCRKGWPTKSALIYHRALVMKVPKFSCPLCPLMFKTSQTLDRHKLTHNTERPFSCELCDKKFKQQRQLDQHKLIMHTEKRYKCHICTRSFVFNYQRMAHLRSHIGYKPFNCPYCPRPFTNTVARHKHVKNLHPDKMDEFLVFKRLNQHEEVRRAGSLPVTTETLKPKEEEHLSVLSLGDGVSSGNKNIEETTKHTETDVVEYVFSSSEYSNNIDSLLENNEQKPSS